jgi:glycosyltransferase involved in cell wall biosynthesis
LPLDGAVVGWVGRLSSEKAPEVLIDALSLDPRGEWRAAFLGDGPMAAAIEARAKAAAVSDRVRMAGSVEEASRFFPAFDVFALSSRTEGTPIVLFEAMAAGIPIVATRVGGVPDVVSDREARLIAPDDPKALADAIVATIADPAASAQRAAAAARRLAAVYDAGDWVARYDAVYRSALTRLAGPGAATPGGGA